MDNERQERKAELEAEKTAELQRLSREINVAGIKNWRGADRIRVKSIAPPSPMPCGLLAGRMRIVIELGEENDGESLSPLQIMERIKEHTLESNVLIEIRGNTVRRQHLDALMHVCNEHLYQTTYNNGVIGHYASWMKNLGFLTLSPARTDEQATYWPAFDVMLDHGPLSDCICFEITVHDADDYAYARQVHQRFPVVPMFLRVTGTRQMRAVTKMLRKSGWTTCNVMPDLERLG